MRIIVIGGGSIGAHVAYRLQQQGAEVTLVEAGHPGRGTSASSVAWLSEFPQMSWTEEPGKAALRPRVHRLFHELADEVPAVADHVHWTGTLLWGTPEERQGYLDGAAIVADRGVKLDVIDGRTAMALEPSIRMDPDEVVFSEPGSAWVDGPGIVAALLGAFERAGGTVVPNARVVELPVADGQVRGVRLEGGALLEADAVVNAAGSWGSHVAALAGLAIPLDLVPGRIIYTQPFSDMDAPSRIINAPEWCGRPDPSGGFAIHWRGGPQEPGHGGNIQDAQELIDEVAKTIPSLRGTAPMRTSIGIRPIPPNGPIVGSLPWLDNLYFTVSHGGIGWAPMWGWMAAREILGGETVPELSAMRPERFYLETSALGRHADDAEQLTPVS